MTPATPTAPTTHVRFFPVDVSTFLDGDYLIKGVAGRILWSLLLQHRDATKLKQIIEIFLDAFDLIESSPDGERLKALVQPFYDNLEQFNAKHEYAVLEPEEKSELADVVRRAAIASGDASASGGSR